MYVCVKISLYRYCKAPSVCVWSVSSFFKACLPVPHFLFESKWPDIIYLPLSHCSMSLSSKGDIGLARAVSCWGLGQSMGVAEGFFRRISPCRHFNYSVLFCLPQDVHLVAYTIYTHTHIYILFLFLCVWCECHACGSVTIQLLWNPLRIPLFKLLPAIYSISGMDCSCSAVFFWLLCVPAELELAL